ncbi:MAG: 30S ribosomal protein S5 [Armatimonadota bacterium]
MARTAFDTAEELEERVVRVDRTRKTVKGGRISSARVVCAVGDGRGNVGVGVGKARDVPSAIEKGMKFARQEMIRVPLDGYTIPHTVKAKVGGAVILLKPASRGTGIIAGGAVRQIVEVSGIRDILTKSLGSGNVFNRAMACFKALQSLYDPREVAARREKSVQELLDREIVDPYEEADAEEEAAAEEEEAVEFEEALLGEDEQAEEDETEEEPAEAEDEAAGEEPEDSEDDYDEDDSDE